MKHYLSVIKFQLVRYKFTILLCWLLYSFGFVADVYISSTKHFCMILLLLGCYLTIVYYDYKSSFWYNIKIPFGKTLLWLISLLVSIYINNLVSSEIFIRTGFSISFFSPVSQSLFLYLIFLTVAIYFSLFLMFIGIVYEVRLFFILIYNMRNVRCFLRVKLIYMFVKFLFPLGIAYSLFANGFYDFLSKKYPIWFDRIFIKNGYFDVMKSSCINKNELLAKYGKELKISPIDSTVISIAMLDNNKYNFSTDRCVRENIEDTK